MGYIRELLLAGVPPVSKGPGEWLLLVVESPAPCSSLGAWRDFPIRGSVECSSCRVVCTLGNATQQGVVALSNSFKGSIVSAKGRSSWGGLTAQGLGLHCTDRGYAQ